MFSDVICEVTLLSTGTRGLTEYSGRSKCFLMLSVRSPFCLQAQEVSQNIRYATADLIIKVTPTNEAAPVITSSLRDFTGYIYENSQKNTLVTNLLGATALRLIVQDPDQVSSRNHGSTLRAGILSLLSDFYTRMLENSWSTRPRFHGLSLMGVFFELFTDRRWPWHDV